MNRCVDSVILQCLYCMIQRRETVTVTLSYLLAFLRVQKFLCHSTHHCVYTCYIRRTQISRLLSVSHKSSFDLFRQLMCVYSHGFIQSQTSHRSTCFFVIVLTKFFLLTFESFLFLIVRFRISLFLIKQHRRFFIVSAISFIISLSIHHFDFKFLLTLTKVDVSVSLKMNFSNFLIH